MTSDPQSDDFGQLGDPQVAQDMLSRVTHGIALNPTLPQLMACCFAVATAEERAELEQMARRECEIFNALATRAGVAKEIAKLKGACYV